MSDRNEDITKFSYPSYRRLKKKLGEFDAVVECNELAIREFLEFVNQSESNLKMLSTKHQIKVDFIQYDRFNSRIRQYYISSVLQQFEQFLHDFKVEFVEYFDPYTWINQVNGETKFKNTIDNINKMNPLIRFNFSPELLNVYEYYRLIRNYISHTDRDLKKIYSLHSAIVTKNECILSEFHSTAKPNSVESINFDDFLIATNVIKHIAFNLSVKAKPPNIRIAKILFDLSKKDHKSTFKGLKKLEKNSERYKKALYSFITTNFGRFSVIEINEVAQELNRLLA